MNRHQIPSRMEYSAASVRSSDLRLNGHQPECTQRLGPVCTGEAGYIGKVSQCENGSVTPAAPADISMFEIWGFDQDNMPEETDDYQR